MIVIYSVVNYCNLNLSDPKKTFFLLIYIYMFKHRILNENWVILNGNVEILIFWKIFFFWHTRPAKQANPTPECLMTSGGGGGSGRSSYD